MKYLPGTHIIARLQAESTDLLHIHTEFREKIDLLIEHFKLQKPGEVYHDFSPAGFTIVIYNDFLPY